MQKRNILIPVILLLFPVLSQAQAWKWAKSIGTANSNTTVKSIKPYSGNSVLVSGTFAATNLALGSHSLANAGQDDGYLAIADAAGQYAWATSFGGSGRDFVVDAAAAPNGDFVVVGNFNSVSLSIGGTNLFNSGETDAFVAKYNQDKTLAWAKKIGSADTDEVSNVAVGTDGNTYVSGQVLDKFTQATKFIFLQKLDVAGNLVWERKGTMQGGLLQVAALTLDGEGGIYLGGAVFGTAVFDGTNLVSSDSSLAAYIVKYKDNGSLLHTYLNPILDKINGLQADGTSLYACAENNGGCIGWGWPLGDTEIHVLKLGSDLSAVWHKSAGGEEFCQSYDIAKSLSVDDGGNIYVTGYFFSDTLHFAGQELPNPYNINYYYPQIFVLKYAPDGTELWGKSLGGIHSDEGTSILAIGDDTFYLGGNFESDPMAIGAYNLHNTGTLDSIYVHLQPARFGRKTMGFLAVFDKTVSSIQPDPVLEQVAIFPNPANGQITVRLKLPAHSPLIFQLHAADGRLLRQAAYGEGISTFEQDVTGLLPGMYIVTLSTGEGVFVGKVVKQ